MQLQMQFLPLGTLINGKKVYHGGHPLMVKKFTIGDTLCEKNKNLM